MYEAAVDRFCRAVSGAGQVEVGQDISGATVERATQAAQFGRDGGDAAMQQSDHRAQVASAMFTVLVAVDGDGVLIEDPGDLDFSVILDGEDGVDAGALPVDGEIVPGVQDAANPVERVPGTSPMPGRGLLDALPTPVQHVVGELDDMKSGPSPRLRLGVFRTRQF